MTKYKVGDVAALFSKPKSPTTTGGKKLQSLFQDYYAKKGRSPNHQEEVSGINKNGGVKEINHESASKKSRKRKFSSNDSELSENISTKKFKESSEQINFPKSNEKKELKMFKKQKDFPRKKKHSKAIMDIYSKPNLSNFNNTGSKFEPENISENDMKSPVVTKWKNMTKDSKQNKATFIKKSKKLSLEHNSSKLSNDVSPKNSEENDAGLREELKEFFKNNSEKKFERSYEKGNTKPEKTFNKKEKLKKNFMSKEDSSIKHEASFEQHKVFKKKDRIDNNQAFPRTKKWSSDNSFNFSSTESKIKYDVEKKSRHESNVMCADNILTEDNNFEIKSSPSKKVTDFIRSKKNKKAGTFERDNVEKSNAEGFDNANGEKFPKKSKKSKQKSNDMYADNLLTEENNSEIVTDFIRNRKNKRADTFNRDNVEKSNAEVFDNANGKKFQNKKFDIRMQKGQLKKFETDAPDFIKLTSSNEGNEKMDEERLSRTLFVGNLPKNISKREVKNLFTAFGIIDRIRLPGIETDKAKIFGKNPPKLLSANYASDSIPGFVVFKEKQSADEALKLSGSMFKNHHITVDFALAPGSHKLYDTKRSIFIGNLPYEVKDESIWNAFNQCGKLEGVRVVRDRQTGLSKGFGYVLFNTVEAKEKALALEELNIEGREIRIKAVDSNKKTQKSDPTSTNRNKRDTFKSRAIRMKKKNITCHKSVKKLTNKQKFLHKKKKTAAILQKAMK